MEHAPVTDASDSGLDEPALRGLPGLLARGLPTVRGRVLESHGRGGALRPHLRSAPLGAGRPRALSSVPRLEVSRGLARRRAGRHPARDRGSQPEWKYSSKNFLKKSAIKRWLFSPPGYFTFRPHRP